MIAGLQCLRALPIADRKSREQSQYNPHVVLTADRIDGLFWPVTGDIGPFVRNSEMPDADELATTVWARLIFIASAGARAGAFLGPVMGFDSPRSSLGGQTVFHACRTYDGFIRALGLVHLTGGADPEAGSMGESLQRDLEALLSLDLSAPVNQRIGDDLEALARAFGGRPQANVIYACHRWRYDHPVSSARGSTLYRMGRRGGRGPIERLLHTLGAK